MIAYFWGRSHQNGLIDSAGHNNDLYFSFRRPLIYRSKTVVCTYQTVLLVEGPLGVQNQTPVSPADQFQLKQKSNRVRLTQFFCQHFTSYLFVNYDNEFNLEKIEHKVAHFRSWENFWKSRICSGGRVEFRPEAVGGCREVRLLEKNHLKHIFNLSHA